MKINKTISIELDVWKRVREETDNVSQYFEDAATEKLNGGERSGGKK